MNGFLKKTLEIDLARRYRELRIAALDQFGKEAVILNETDTSVTFLAKNENGAFLGYSNGMKSMELIPLDDVTVSALITAYGKNK